MTDPEQSPAMIPALKNRSSNITHLRTQSGKAYCGATWAGREIVCEVRYPGQINCARCRADKAFGIFERAVEGFNEQGAWFVARAKPPRESKRGKAS